MSSFSYSRAHLTSALHFPTCNLSQLRHSYCFALPTITPIVGPATAIINGWMSLFAATLPLPVEATNTTLLSTRRQPRLAHRTSNRLATRTGILSTCTIVMNGRHHWYECRHCHEWHHCCKSINSALESANGVRTLKEKKRKRLYFLFIFYLGAGFLFTTFTYYVSLPRLDMLCSSVAIRASNVFFSFTRHGYYNWRLFVLTLLFYITGVFCFDTVILY